MPSNAITVKAPALQHWAEQIFLRAGSSSQEAQLTAHHLVLANLSGHDSHGIGMVPRYIDSWLAGGLKLNQTIRLESDFGAMISVDGGHGMGQSVTYQAMNLAIERAKQFGVCVMGLHNSHHLGRVGHWAEQAIAAGMVSIHFTNVNSPAWVAPFGGTQGRMVTNPFTVGVPRPGREPLLLDFATSTIAHGKARVAYNKGVTVPPGALIDHAGQPTLEPKVLFEDPIGALTAFGGHKGYALAVMCEILGGGLSGGRTLRPETVPDTPAIWNHMLAIVFDPAKMGSLERFESEVSAFEQWNRSAKTAVGVDKIRMPGDTERESQAARGLHGIPIDAGTLAQLDQAAVHVNAAPRVNGHDAKALAPVGLASALALAN
jgi:hydroxycarboxylate dehydrogenase B